VLRVSARDCKTAELPVAVSALDLPLAVTLTHASVIRGVVQDEYEQPAPGVEVRLEALGRAARSDATGHFVLPVPSPGQYVLSAHHSEWGSGSVRVEAPAEQVRVMLEPRGTVDVLVEHNGRRVEGASASLRQGDRELLASEEPSGSDGVVRLRGIPPGSYQVIAFHAELQTAEPLRVDLREGDTVRVRVVLGEGAQVTGQVVDGKGEPVAGAELHAPASRRPAVTDAQGRFELGALKPRATVALRFSHPGYDAPEQLSAVAGGAPVKVQVRARQLFTGRVVAPDGAPVGHCEINGREVRDADGRFSLPLAVVDGKVTLVLQAHGFQPKQVELSAARDLGNIPLTLAPRAVGTVKDESDKPVPQAVVTCKECDEAGAAGPDGRFTLALPASGGKVELAGRRWNMEGSATVEPGQAEVTVKLRSPSRLTGVVYDEQGKPAEGKEVAVLDAQRGTALMFLSGVKGTYRMEVAPGVYRFFVGGFVPGGPLSMSGREMLIHEVKGREATLDLGNAEGGEPLTVRVDPRPGYALWVVRGDLEKVGNPPEELNRAAYARLVYEPSEGRVAFRGLAPGRYTVVWGGYHMDTAGGPRVVKVDVPTPDEVVLDPLTAP
ncbi:MAG: carboxypeptidase regulatory-like domain-containing protein, partial [Deltaproteobacteria bacterium]|nr:carboxypeptidase regulatory-like domain-containing protein [Deltaproteobacteria bacterium]